MNLYEWAGKELFVSLKLEVEGQKDGFEPAISDFPSRQL